jgi:serine protease inhibitor
MRWPFTRPNPEGAAVLPDETTAPPEIRFTFKLFHELVRQDPSANIFFSPCSVMLCLAMVYDGARGETRSGMANALQLSGLDSEGVESTVARLRSVFQKRAADVQLLMSNSLWCNRSIHVLPAFTARARDIYDADVHEIEFAAADAAARINAWVSEKTADKIPHMVDRLDALTLMVALNAIYFKGLWRQPFERILTRDEPFTTGSGKKKTLPRMLQMGSFRYWEQPEFQAVVLPYQGSRIAMYLFLPARNSSLEKLHSSLSAARWDMWRKQFAETRGSVRLPRFKMSYSAWLRPALIKLGMERAFDPKRAEFGGIRNEPPQVWIDQVLHRAIAEVNEEGTEAAAATMSVLMATSALRPQRPEPSFQMIVDRPFLFLIRDETSGNILFLGSVVDPSA